MAAENRPAADEEAQEEKAEHPERSGPPRRRATDYTESILAGQTVVAVAVVLTISYFAKLVLVTLFVAILLAFMLEPMVAFFERIRLPRPVGAVLALLVFAAGLYGATYFGYNRAVSFVQNLPQYSGKIKHAVVRVREQAQKIQKSTQDVLPQSQSDGKTVTVEQRTSWSEFVTGSLGTVGEILLAVSFIPFLVYFMLTWQDHVRAATVMLFKMENRNTAYVTLGRISAVIRTFINGNLIVGVFTSIISTIVFASLKLDYWYFIGVISGFLSLVPYLGVILAMIPPLAAGLGTLHGAGLLIIVMTVLLIHLFAINVLYPKFVGGRLQLNPLAVTIALLIWGWLWGAMGLILAIPITAALKTIFDNVDSLRPYGAWMGE